MKISFCLIALVAAQEKKPAQRVANLMAKMEVFQQEWLATASQPDRGQKLVMRYQKNAQEMVDHYEANFKVNCITPPPMEEDEDNERYLVGCTGAKRLPQQLAQWSATYNANCDGTSTKFSRNKGKHMNRQQRNIQKQLEC